MSIIAVLITAAAIAGPQVRVQSARSIALHAGRPCAMFFERESED